MVGYRNGYANVTFYRGIVAKRKQDVNELIYAAEIGCVDALSAQGDRTEGTTAKARQQNDVIKQWSRHQYSCRAKPPGKWYNQWQT